MSGRSKTTRDPARSQRRRRVLAGELRGPNLRAAVAANIRRLRRDLDLTLNGMAERTGINASYIGAMERGTQNITVDSLSNLAEAYGVQAHDLICGHAPPPEPIKLVTLDLLAHFTSALDQRAQKLLLDAGPVPVGAASMASIIAALFEALGQREQAGSFDFRGQTDLTPRSLK